MRGLALLAYLAGYLFGQAGPSRPASEVAVVRMYPAGAVVAPGILGFEELLDRLRASHVALGRCLQWGPTKS
jgi:hypothetical protein